MRIPKLETYAAGAAEVETIQLGKVPTASRYTLLVSDREKVKYVKYLERIVRSSQEYKDYVAFLKEHIDMTKCSFFNNVQNNGKNKVKIEIHHEPFTLFDITQIVLEKYISMNLGINAYTMAEEIMKIHYQNKVGLIPLSITVHQLIHLGKLFIPLQNVRGNFVSFIEEYDNFISDELKDKLELKLKMSQDLDNQKLSILNKKYTYLQVDGFVLPETLDEIVSMQD